VVSSGHLRLPVPEGFIKMLVFRVFSDIKEFVLEDQPPVCLNTHFEEHLVLRIVL